MTPRAGLVRWLALSCAAVASFLSSPGFAQESSTRVSETNGDGMDTHLFRPAIDSKGFFSTNGTDIIGANDISFGLVLDYGTNILRTKDDGVPTDASGQINGPGSGVPALVEDSFQGTFSFNYGIANTAVIGLAVPVVLMTGGANDNAGQAFQIGPNGNLYNTGEYNVQKLSNLSLHGKLRLTRVDRGIGVAVLAQAGIPMADSERDLAADPGFWYWPQLAVENQFGRTRRFKVALNVGYRGHTGENPLFQQDSTGADQLAEGELEYGNLATANLGVSWRVLDPLDLVAETYATYLLGGKSDSKQRLSQEYLGGLKLFVERNSYLMLGAGSRAYSTGFQAADMRMVMGFVFEPSIGDRDGDGIKDDQDQCPDDPEDMDGFQDADGCPDLDNDNDGILDVDDRCPNVPEDRDGDQDDDGCPEGNDGDRDGDGILDSRDKCPDDPEDRDGFQDADGCPDPDNDKDGIPDVDDQCPLDPEDKDGFQDEDGCPDPDNDQDGIPDVSDKCPNEPETFNGFEDEDGCPDKGRVLIEGSDIVILDKVQFKTGSSEILAESFPILDAVASTLKGHPEFLKVEVAGHADERSTDAYNLTLTTARAKAVLDAIVSRGVARDRLVSQGYGEYCPLDPASNAAAWEKNRRVEFKVVRTEDGTTGAERGCERARLAGVLPPKVD